VGSLAAVDEVEFEGVGGIHSSSPLENPKDRPRRLRPPRHPRNAPAPGRLRPRPCNPTLSLLRHTHLL
jgi:hypothetical protein